MKDDKIAALNADFQQLKTELGAFGVNLTPGAKTSLAAVEERIAELAEDKPKSKAKPE